MFWLQRQYEKEARHRQYLCKQSTNYNLPKKHFHSTLGSIPCKRHLVTHEHPIIMIFNQVYIVFIEFHYHIQNFPSNLPTNSRTNVHKNRQVKPKMIAKYNVIYKVHKAMIYMLIVCHENKITNLFLSNLSFHQANMKFLSKLPNRY